MVEGVFDIEDDETERIKTVLEKHNALTESQEEDIHRSSSNKDDPMMDDDAMRSGRAANKINVAEESDDKEEADTEEGVDIADDTTGPVKKVKDAHTRAGRFSEMMFL